MGSSAVSTKTRSTAFAKILCLPLVASSAAVAAAYSNSYQRHTRTFGSIDSRTTFNGATPPFPFRQRARILNQDHFPSRRRAVASASTTARQSTTSTDEATTSADATYTTTSRLSPADVGHMKRAARHARVGYGNTFPNPAVGCVIVRHRDDDDDPSAEDVVVGAGFHPRAGMPHAEVFALLEACGHVEDGVAAAGSVADDASGDEGTLAERVLELFATYKSEGGASELFGGRLADVDVTAYVTLEPCCHWGQTPPCASSLAAAGIDRVVVGYRDPNPRVDGGGIAVLQDAGIGVRVLGQTSENGDESPSSEEMEGATECSDLVKYFVKRISPREGPAEKLDDVVNGKKRRALRSIAGRQKSDGSMRQIGWPKDDSITGDDKKSGDFAEQVPLGNRFLESVDETLWDCEIVLLRLNNVVSKKKGAKIIGGRIAEVLNAHVAQVIGHTALLYRPGFPPVLDLDELVKEDTGDTASD